MQYRLTPADLDTVLAMVRGGTLAGAGERLGVDPSTVFRGLRRLERRLGRPLFVRSRRGYEPSETALRLAEQAEQVEAALDQARAITREAPASVAGRVRITTTDTILHGLVAPALAPWAARHPLLELELHTGNELASLSRRDADIAVRATKKPPPHLVGRCVGPIRIAPYAARGGAVVDLATALAGGVDWIAPDDALPEHPSVLWRRRVAPRLVPRWRVGSLLTVAELVAAGIGVGVLPLFLGEARPDLVRLGDPLDGFDTDLWLLTHPESRHLRRVAAVYTHLADTLRLA